MREDQEKSDAADVDLCGRQSSDKENPSWSDFTLLSCREGGGQTSGTGVGHKGLRTFRVLTNLARKLFSTENKHHYL